MRSIVVFIKDNKLGVCNTAVSFVVFILCFFIINYYNHDKRDINDISYVILGNDGIPNKLYSNPVSPILLGLYEGLFKVSESGEIIPGAIEYSNFDVANNAYDFLIKQTALWSNGEHVYASDFVRGIKQLANPDNKSPHRWLIRYIKNGRSILEGKVSYKELGVHAINSRLLRIFPASKLDNGFFHNAFFALLATGPFLPAHKTGLHIFNGSWKIKKSIKNVLKSPIIFNEQYYVKHISHPKTIKVISYQYSGDGDSDAKDAIHTLFKNSNAQIFIINPPRYFINYNSSHYNSNNYNKIDQVQDTDDFTHDVVKQHADAVNYNVAKNVDDKHKDDIANFINHSQEDNSSDINSNAQDKQYKNTKYKNTKYADMQYRSNSSNSNSKSQHALQIDRNHYSANSSNDHKNHYRKHNQKFIDRHDKIEHQHLDEEYTKVHTKDNAKDIVLRQLVTYEDIMTQISNIENVTIKSSKYDYLTYCKINHPQANSLRKNIAHTINRNKIISSILSNKYANNAYPAYDLLPWRYGDRDNIRYYNMHDIDIKDILSIQQAKAIRGNSSNTISNIKTIRYDKTVTLSTNLEGDLFDIIAHQLASINIKLEKMHWSKIGSENKNAKTAVNNKLYSVQSNFHCSMVQAYYQHPTSFIYQISDIYDIDAFHKDFIRKFHAKNLDNAKNNENTGIHGASQSGIIGRNKSFNNNEYQKYHKGQKAKMHTDNNVRRMQYKEVEYYSAMAEHIMQVKHIVPLYFTGKIAVITDNINFNLQPYGRFTPLEYAMQT